MDTVVDIKGIGNHVIQNAPLVKAGGVVPTKNGTVIAVFNNYAYIPNHPTIHSSIQLEASGNIVNDKSIGGPGGSQCIIT